MTQQRPQLSLKWLSDGDFTMPIFPIIHFPTNELSLTLEGAAKKYHTCQVHQFIISVKKAPLNVLLIESHLNVIYSSIISLKISLIVENLIWKVYLGRFIFSNIFRRGIPLVNPPRPLLWLHRFGTDEIRISTSKRNISWRVGWFWSLPFSLNKALSEANDLNSCCDRNWAHKKRSRIGIS